MFYNNERVVPYWSEELIKLIYYLGVVRIRSSVFSIMHLTSPILGKRLRLDCRVT